MPVGISEPTQWPKEQEPKEYGGRSYTYYQATQAQRRREREIRALKREADGMKAAGLTQQARQLEGRIRAMTEEYEDFSAAMEIRPKNERLWVCEGIGSFMVPDVITDAYRYKYAEFENDKSLQRHVDKHLTEYPGMSEKEYVRNAGSCCNLPHRMIYCL